jgi:hypothetical protein
MSKFNIFRNRNIDTQVRNLLDKFEDELNKQTEDYWRKVIATEIYQSCPVAKRGGYPCEECYELHEFVLYKKETSHDG